MRRLAYCMESIQSRWIIWKRRVIHAGRQACMNMSISREGLTLPEIWLGGPQGQIDNFGTEGNPSNSQALNSKMDNWMKRRSMIVP